ncbi:MAG: c-type cytochrome [Phenylobacterium sp.]|uniref:c-type cytochrome n=1 Tax=Phenylobacterium sp. TaxID=1871053 RepID=UPI0025EB323A|nr:c-type cytochrome [Phenylobacterium sp.]MBI1198773.1 c-type cytochrome [Phenylobacterium sp.]
MFRLAALASALSLAALPALAADGEQLFNIQCRQCHMGSIMGPSLVGTAGGPIAAKPGFTYTPGLKAKSDQTWTDENLDAFLKGPAAFAPGTKMFATVPSDEARAALIAYLKTLK